MLVLRLKIKYFKFIKTIKYYDVNVQSANFFIKIILRICMEKLENT